MGAKCGDEEDIEGRVLYEGLELGSDSKGSWQGYDSALL
jgi:hypothetical protein